MYKSPQHERPRSRVRVVPSTSKNYNYVFVRAPEVRIKPRVVVSPPQQKTKIYLLSEGSRIEQEVVQLPFVEDKPEVYFINNYRSSDQNVDLPGGINLQTALAQESSDGVLVDSSKDSELSLYAKIEELPDKTITGAVQTAPSGLETFERIPEEDAGKTEAEGGATDYEADETVVPVESDSIFTGEEADTAGDQSVTDIDTTPVLEPAVQVSEAIDTSSNNPITFPAQSGKFDDPIPDLSLTSGKSMDSSVTDVNFNPDNVAVDKTDKVDSSRTGTSAFDPAIASNFGQDGVIFIIDDGSNFDGTGQTMIISTGMPVANDQGQGVSSFQGISMNALQDLIKSSLAANTAVSTQTSPTTALEQKGLGGVGANKLAAIVSATTSQINVPKDADSLVGSTLEASEIRDVPLIIENDLTSQTIGDNIADFSLGESLDPIADSNPPNLDVLKEEVVPVFQFPPPFISRVNTNTLSTGKTLLSEQKSTQSIIGGFGKSLESTSKALIQAEDLTTPVIAQEPNQIIVNTMKSLLDDFPQEDTTVDQRTTPSLSQLISGSGLAMGGPALGADVIVKHIPERVTKL